MLAMWIISELVIAIMAIMFGYPSIFIFGTIWSCIIGFTAKKVLKNNKRLCKSVFALWIVLCFFCLLIYGIYYVKYGIPYDMAGLDDYTYDIESSDICIKNGIYSIQDMNKYQKYSLHNSKLYLLLIVWIKIASGWIGGYHTMIIRMFNLMFLVMCAIFMSGYAIRNLEFDSQSAKKLLFFIGLFPNSVYISSMVWRDVVIAGLLCMTLYMWSGFFDKKLKSKILTTIMSGGVIFCIYYIRHITVVFMFFIIVACLSTKYAQEKLFKIGASRRKMVIILFALIGLVFAAGTLGYWINRYFTGYNMMAEVASSRRINLIIKRIPIIPFGWIARTMFYMILPLYYRDFFFLNGLDGGLAFIRIAISLGTIYLICWYPRLLKYAIKKRTALCWIYLTMLVSVAVSTSGFRHVIMLYPFLFTMLFDCKRRNFFVGNKALFVGNQNIAFLKEVVPTQRERL